MDREETVRVRFAPSPTGPLHIGGARTALYNYLFARAQGGVFVLRIDDTDRERSTAESLDQILRALTWLGLDWDEGPEKDGPYGPYFQSEKLARYRAVADRLLADGKAYRCFCSPEEVEAGRARMRERVGASMYDRRCRALDPEDAARRAAAGEAFTVRFKTPLEGMLRIDDLIKGPVEVPLEQVDDWVMLRRDGSPLYNLCSAVDDTDMRITHVIRGEEHLINAVKQKLLFDALGAAAPAFAHLPLILGKDGRKLSKRMAQTDLLDYAKQGIPPEALVNFFARLGWAIDDKTEVFTLDEAIRAFRLEDVGKSGSKLDEEKLHWLSGVWIRRMEPAEILRRALPWLEEKGIVQPEDLERQRDRLERIVACYRERIRNFAELPDKVAFFFGDEVSYDAKAWKNLTKQPETAAWLRAWVEDLPRDEWPAAGELERRARALAERLGIGFGKLVHPLRAALTGTTVGAGLFDIVEILGPELVRRRVRRAIAALEDAGRA